MSHQNQTFATAFKAVLIFLVVVTFVIFILARFIGGDQTTEHRHDPSYQRMVEQRIAPVGQVNTGPPGGAAPTPSASQGQQAPAAPSALAQGQAAGGGDPLAQGKQVYTSVCFACHGTGAAGAPKADDKAAWATRAAQGMDALVQHAVQGFKAMPAKGGNPALSEQEVRNAVAYMLEQAGVKAGQGSAPVASTPAGSPPAAPAPLPAATAPAAGEAPPTGQSAGPSPAPSPASAQPPAPAPRTAVPPTPPAVAGGAQGQHDPGRGEKVYAGACVTCHATGVVGAPKLGDTAEWKPRIAQGTDTLVQHAIQGFQGPKGVMPPKGGYANLSDAEVADAVAYMVQRSR